MVAVLEVLKEWTGGEGMDLCNFGSTMGCNNKELLRTHHEDHWFASHQKDFDLLKSLKLETKNWAVTSKGDGSQGTKMITANQKIQIGGMGQM